jgi:octaprenyl-diphosphate synthase
VNQRESSDATCGRPGLDDWQSGIRALIAERIARTSLASIAETILQQVAGGKMLRARLAFHLTCEREEEEVRCQGMLAGAAIELIHSASLLHDDVVDQAEVRRHAPAFWVERGRSASILLGDFFVCQAMLLLENTPDLARALVRFAAEMCDAEVQQELLLRGAEPTWDKCVEIARGKTGSLFAFVASACASDDPPLRKALAEAGYLIGTAYQLADDVLDAYGDAGTVGKSLGNDARAQKVTAVSAAHRDRVEPLGYIRGLHDKSEQVLRPWPSVQSAWCAYLEHDFRPAVQRVLGQVEHGTGDDA